MGGEESIWVSHTESQRTNAWGGSASTVRVEWQKALAFSQSFEKRFALYQNGEYNGRHFLFSH